MSNLAIQKGKWLDELPDIWTAKKDNFYLDLKPENFHRVREGKVHDSPQSTYQDSYDKRNHITANPLDSKHNFPTNNGVMSDENNLPPRIKAEREKMNRRIQIMSSLEEQDAIKMIRLFYGSHISVENSTLLPTQMLKALQERRVCETSFKPKLRRTKEVIADRVTVKEESNDHEKWNRLSVKYNDNERGKFLSSGVKENVNKMYLEKYTKLFEEMKKVYPNFNMRPKFTQEINQDLIAGIFNQCQALVKNNQHDIAYQKLQQIYKVV